MKNYFNCLTHPNNFLTHTQLNFNICILVIISADVNGYEINRKEKIRTYQTMLE